MHVFPCIKQRNLRVGPPTGVGPQRRIVLDWTVKKIKPYRTCMESSYLHAFFYQIAKQDVKFSCQQAESLELEKAGFECKRGDLTNLMSKWVWKWLQRSVWVCAHWQSFAVWMVVHINTYMLHCSWRRDCSRVNPKSMYTNGNLQVCAGCEFLMVWGDVMSYVHLLQSSAKPALPTFTKPTILIQPRLN